MFRWKITHDPYLVKLKGRTYEVDLAAEQLVAAEKDAVKIAVEIKSLVSPVNQLRISWCIGAIPKLPHVHGKARQEPDRVLYLAVPKKIYQTFFMEEGTMLIVETFKINLAVFNPGTKCIEQWIPTY